VGARRGRHGAGAGDTARPGRRTVGVRRDPLVATVQVERDRVRRQRGREEAVGDEARAERGHPRRQLLEEEAGAGGRHRRAALLHAPPRHLRPHAWRRACQLRVDRRLLGGRQVVWQVEDGGERADAPGGERRGERARRGAKDRRE
jgi:hypothetical protein